MCKSRPEKYHWGLAIRAGQPIFMHCLVPCQFKHQHDVSSLRIWDLGTISIQHNEFHKWIWQYQSENKVGQQVAYPQQVFTTVPFVAMLIAADTSAFGDISISFWDLFSKTNSEIMNDLITPLLHHSLEVPEKSVVQHLPLELQRWQQGCSRPAAVLYQHRSFLCSPGFCSKTSNLFLFLPRVK